MEKSKLRMIVSASVISVVVVLIITILTRLGYLSNNTVLAIVFLTLAIVFAVIAIVFGVKIIIKGVDKNLTVFVTGIAVLLVAVATIPVNILQIVSQVNDDKAYTNCLTKYQEWDDLMTEKSSQFNTSNAVANSISLTQIETACRDGSQRPEVVSSLEDAIEALSQ